MAALKRFVNHDDCGFVAGFLFSERAAIEQWDAKHGKVIWRHLVVRGKIVLFFLHNELAIRPPGELASHLDRAIWIRLERAAFHIRPIPDGSSGILDRFTQWWSAGPYDIFHHRCGDQAFM